MASRSPSPVAHHRGCSNTAVPPAAAAAALLHESAAAVATVLLLLLVLIVAPFVTDGEGTVCRKIPLRLQRFLRDATSTWLVMNVFHFTLAAFGLLLSGQLRTLVLHICAHPSHHRYSNTRNGVLDFFVATSDALLGHVGRPPLLIFVHGVRRESPAQLTMVQL
jgi:hypothetical protein